MTLYAFLTCIALLCYFQAALYLFFYLPQTKVNRIFGLVLVSLAWISFFYLLMQFAEPPDTVIKLDRASSIGWIAFPWLMLLFVYHATNLQYKIIRRVIYFVMTPLALASLVGYLWQADAIRFFDRAESGVLYFDAYHWSVFYILGLIFLNGCAVMLVWMFWKWYHTKRQTVSSKAKVFTGVLFLSVVFFISFNAFSHFVLPLTGNSSLPPAIHLTALPMIAVLFTGIALLRPQRYLPEMLKKLFVERIREFVFYADEKGHVFSTNSYSLEVLGYEHREITGKSCSQLFKPVSLIQTLFSIDDDRKRERPQFCYLVPKNGEAVPVLLNVTHIYDDFYNLLGFFLVASDYRQSRSLRREHKARLFAEQKLLALNDELEEKIRLEAMLLEESREKLHIEAARQEASRQQIIKEFEAKENMLREIHHRVKNNIQMMISLVSIEQGRIEELSPMKKVYGSISNWVREISVIHDYLYDSPYIGRINFSSFIHKIAGVLRSRHLNMENVLFNIALAEHKLSIDQAIPCGIIAHELISNSLRFAFPVESITGQQHSDQIPTIGIEFYMEKGHYVLHINDNGIGLPMENGRPKNIQTGLGLVNSLVNTYLNGEIRYNVRYGTSVIIRFPVFPEAS